MASPERRRSRSPAHERASPPLVSVVVACYNGEAFLSDCLASVAAQTYRPLELSFWNDASTDGSVALLESLLPGLEAEGLSVKVGHTVGDKPGGAGHAKMSAIQQSTGRYICFQDCDDVSIPQRVERQLAIAEENPTALVGCNFVREPPTATPHYAAWANDLTDEQLHWEKFCECTIIIPTWFCHRDVIPAAGGLSSSGHAGTVEDLLFFHEHLKLGRRLRKVPEPLVVYRQHPGQLSVCSIPFAPIWNVRVSFLASHLLADVEQFSICSSGRDAKKLYRQLSLETRAKCKCFVDVDSKKLESTTAGLADKELNRHVPVVAYAAGLPTPLIICWKRGFDPASEASLRSLDLQEGKDFWHFFRSYA